MLQAITDQRLLLTLTLLTSMITVGCGREPGPTDQLNDLVSTAEEMVTVVESIENSDDADRVADRLLEMSRHLAELKAKVDEQREQIPERVWDRQIDKYESAVLGFHRALLNLSEHDRSAYRRLRRVEDRMKRLL